MQYSEYNRMFNQQQDTKAQKEATEKKKRKEEERKFKENSWSHSHGTSNNNQQNDEKWVANEMPYDPKGCPVPKCDATADESTGGHKYVLRCPALKKMTVNEHWDFYRQKKSTCQACFSVSHKADVCPLTRKGHVKKCQEKLTQGPRAGQTCNKLHHKLLHYEKKPKTQQNQSATVNENKGPT